MRNAEATGHVMFIRRFRAMYRAPTTWMFRTRGMKKRVAVARAWTSTMDRTIPRRRERTGARRDEKAMNTLARARRGGGGGEGGESPAAIANAGRYAPVGSAGFAA